MRKLLLLGLMSCAGSAGYATVERPTMRWGVNLSGPQILHPSMGEIIEHKEHARTYAGSRFEGWSGLLPAPWVSPLCGGERAAHLDRGWWHPSFDAQEVVLGPNDQGVVDDGKRRQRPFIEVAGADLPVLAIGDNHRTDALFADEVDVACRMHGRCREVAAQSLSPNQFSAGRIQATEDSTGVSDHVDQVVDQDGGYNARNLT